MSDQNPSPTDRSNAVTNTLQEISDVVHNLDPELDRQDDGYKIAIVLLASAQIGADMERLAAFTGFDRDWLADVDANLRKSEVWVGERLQVNWFDPQGGGVDFWIDVAVAQGYLERAVDDGPAEDE